MNTRGRQTLGKIAIWVISTILVVTIGGCGVNVSTSSPASPEPSTQQVELNGVRLSVPENWYSQISPENEKVQRILVSARSPVVHGDVRIYTNEIQKPLEGPWIELVLIAQYVKPEKSSSTQTVPGSGAQIVVFRDVEVGPFTTDQYYVPSNNVMITTRYWTPEEGSLVSQIISSVTIID